MMKHIPIHLFLFFSIITFSSSAQWTVNMTPVPGLYAAFDIHYINNNVGFIGGNTALVNGDGKISKTTNAGNTWTDVLTVAGTVVKDIDFVNDNLGFAIGSGGLIAKTIDGGNNWTNEIYINPNTSNPESFESVHFVDQNIGYIAGGLNEMWVLKTTDGGANWTPLTMPAYFQRLKAVHFTDANTGYIAGGDGTGGGTGEVYKTTDGGVTWIALSTGITNNYYTDIHFTDTNIGVIGCNIDGTIIRTTDAGLNWTTVTNPAGISSVEEFSFVNASLGYAAIISGKIIKTTDGGASWSLDGDTAPILSGLYSISVPTQTYGATSGLFGLYAELSGTSSINALTNEANFSIYPNPTAGQFTIEVPDNLQENTEIKVFDVTSRLIIKKTLKTGQKTMGLDITDYNNGVYYLQLNIDGKQYVHQLLKN